LERYTYVISRRALELLQKALALSDDERAALASSLLESLDAAVDEDVESAWQQEISRRIADLDSGKARPFRGMRFGHEFPAG